MVILTNVFYRLFGNSLLLCLYALSLVRLEISWQPFRFKAHSHGRLSVLLLVLILGLPLVEVAVRLAVVEEGQTCDRDSLLLVLGLYQQELGPPGLSGMVNWMLGKMYFYFLAT